MNILFDQGTPVPLRRFLPGHVVITAFEKGWSNLSNGQLLAEAEAAVDLFITTDQNLRSQQNLDRFRLAILVLPTTNWLQICEHVAEIAAAVESIPSGGYRQLHW